jgi:hypothetical protein
MSFTGLFPAAKAAVLSPCGRYRYSLSRTWGDGGTVCFVMLNPSTADADADDPTVRRCIGFAKAWGYASLAVRNLFNLRSPSPKALLTAEDPVGPEGDRYLREAVCYDLVVAAWGSAVPLGRGREALPLLRWKPLHVLGWTTTGHPRHPLYVKGSARPLLWKEAHREKV